MHQPSPANQGIATDTEHDPRRLACLDSQEGYSPFVPLPGMVAHGHFPSNIDPIPVYNFGQFHTPQQYMQPQAQHSNVAQQAQSHPYQHTYEQPRFHEPQPQQAHHFQGLTPPLNTQAMPFTPRAQSLFANPATFQQAQSEENNFHSFPTSLSSTVQVQQEQLARQSAQFDILSKQMEEL